MKPILSSLGVLAFLLLTISAVQVKPIDLAIAPHCCATGAAEACRDFCRQQGPGCKGTIGCRAGECVCTCSC